MSNNTSICLPQTTFVYFIAETTTKNQVYTEITNQKPTDYPQYMFYFVEMWVAIAFTLFVILITFFVAYKMGKKKGKEEIDKKSSKNQLLGDMELHELFGNTEKPHKSPSLKAIEPLSLYSSNISNNKSNCKDEASSTNSSPGLSNKSFELSARSDLLLNNGFNLNHSTNCLELHSDQKVPIYDQTNKENQDDNLIVKDFTKNFKNQNIKSDCGSNITDSLSVVTSPTLIPLNNNNPVDQDSLNDKNQNLAVIPWIDTNKCLCEHLHQIPKPSTENEEVKIEEEITIKPQELVFNIEYDNKNDEVPTNSFGKKFFEPKMKLGDEKDIKDCKGKMAISIRENDGYIEVKEQTEITVLYKSTEIVQQNLESINVVTEKAQEKLNVFRLITEQGENPIPDQKLKVPSSNNQAPDSKNNLDSKSDSLEESKIISNIDIKHDHQLCLKPITTIVNNTKKPKVDSPTNSIFEMIQKVNLAGDLNQLRQFEAQLHQYIRINMDIPDETGKFLRTFSDAEMIGEGSYGKVYKAKQKLDNRIYAIKKVEVKLHLNEKDIRETKVFREVKAMANLRHASIVAYSTVWVEFETNIEQIKKYQINRQNKFKNENESVKINGFKLINTNIYNRSIKNTDPLTPFMKSKTLVRSETSDLGFEWDNGSNANHNAMIGNISETESRLESRALNDTDNSEQLKSISKTLMSSKNDSDDSNCSIDGSRTDDKIDDENISLIHKFVKIFIYIQMEYCSGQTLKKYLQTWQKKFSRLEILKMFKKLLEGMVVIHDAGIIHRDLKPDNIFLDENKNIKIGDFGLASLENIKYNADILSPELSPDIDLPIKYNGDSQERNQRSAKRMQSVNIGTPMYISPEQEKGGDYNEKTDVYSLGLIFFEMLAGFSTSHERYKHFKDLRDNNKIPPEFNALYPHESKLIVQMTNKIPNDRPSVKTIVESIALIISNIQNH